MKIIKITIPVWVMIFFIFLSFKFEYINLLLFVVFLYTRTIYKYTRKEVIEGVFIKLFDFLAL